jgi:hypothetical protein
MHVKPCQHANYIVKQLVVFQRTVDRPEGSIMKTSRIR